MITVLLPRSTLAGAIGNTVEWLDFAVYGYFAREIGEAFCPADVPSLQQLSAFAVFAVFAVALALQRLFLLLRPGGGTARRHAAADRHLAGGEPGVQPGAGAELPALGGAHAAGLPPAGAASPARLAELSRQGATRTSEPEIAVGWLPGAFVIV